MDNPDKYHKYICWILNVYTPFTNPDTPFFLFLRSKVTQIIPPSSPIEAFLVLCLHRPLPKPFHLSQSPFHTHFSIYKIVHPL